MIIESQEEQNERQVSVFVADTAKNKFLDYGISVIVERALPDVRDGLKPVHRRILYGMHGLSLTHTKAHKKSARVVGDVIGKYHPHGDVAVYDAMVRMAQPFSMRVPLVDGHGNFGSVDGDAPAAMRYTEARMSLFGEQMFQDIGLNVVDYHPNYDETTDEPNVLPCPFPNLMINGIQGIAVGMASYIPPHNPVEVMQATRQLIEGRVFDREISSDMLFKLVSAPDFPTGGLVYQLSGTREAWETGRGAVRLRAKWHEEELSNNRTSIVITEIPYQVNKSKLEKKIVELAKPSKNNNGLPEVEGISEVRDESDKDGLRLYIGLKRDFSAETVFNQLARLSQLEVSINYNVTVLVNGQPKQVGLRSLLEHFIDFRLDVICKRTQALADKAKARLRMVSALIKALDEKNIDRVIAAIKSSASPDVANTALCDLLEIESDQAKAILDMRLQRLTSLQANELRDEKSVLEARLIEYAEILSSQITQLHILDNECEKQIEWFNQSTHYMGGSLGQRKTEVASHLAVLDSEDLVEAEPCVVFLTARGYIRRLSLMDLTAQNKNTVGKRQMKLASDDYLIKSIESHTRHNLIAVTERGRVIGIKTHQIPDSEKGRFAENVLDLRGEKLTQLLSVPDFSDDLSLVFLTQQGLAKRTTLSQYANCMRSGGIIGINLRDDDRLVFVGAGKETDQIMTYSSDGRVNRYPMAELRTVGRNSMGNISQRVNEGAYVLGGNLIEENDVNGYLVTLSQKGMVKITALSEYPSRSRRAKGVKAMKVSERTGSLFAILLAKSLQDELVVTTRQGINNRISLGKVNETGRNTLGVNFITLRDKDALADAFLISDLQ